jgi:hypothetical protein
MNQVKGKKWPWEIEVVYSGRHPEIRPTAEMILSSAQSVIAQRE